VIELVKRFKIREEEKFGENGSKKGLNGGK
jgi:hypothetical protein